MIKCMNCNGDMIYLGKGQNIFSYALNNIYNYKCSECGSVEWSSFKEKSKYKWYKLEKVGITMKKIYLCYGGNIISSYDGQEHYISPYSLPNYYKVSKVNCLFMTNKNCDGINPKNYICLYPKNDGNYKITFKQKVIYKLRKFIRKYRR